MEIHQETDRDISVNVRFRLNGVAYYKPAPVNWTLLRFLRDDLGVYGTKCGCEVGECGACTVIINGLAVNSCLIMASQVDGADIWTIEGVATPGTNSLHPVQEAFIERDAIHCGFCTPGTIMSTIALLLKNKRPGDDEIKIALAGNLCRCTGYIQIIEAVKKAASSISAKDLEKFIPKKR
ncbi:MAG: (2Fe-2S)-binding protein [candidate division Zixibacteria bacterium]|nr:(2Fe-2S)-binding protein [candidate division Zixibacteria bacterium]